jgi:predicted DNA-binding transcriptional regulator AlpA
MTLAPAARPTAPHNRVGNPPLPNLLAAAEAFGHFLNCLGLALPSEPAPAIERNTQPTTGSPEIGGKELAREITGLSYARIYALVSQRAIPHSKRGNRLYFNRAELLAWVAEGKREENKK